MAIALLYVCAITVAVAQHPGNGIAKYTLAVSNPLDALHWVYSVGFPVINCRGSQFCNATDKCGLIGRSNLCKTQACKESSPMASFMWPHMINASGRPYADLSIERAEAEFDAKVGASFSKLMYDPFLDYSFVVYAKSLDKWIQGVDAVTNSSEAAPFKDGRTKKWLALQWKDNVNATWYSVIFHIPSTQSIVEVISDAEPSKSVVTGEELLHDPLARYPATALCVDNGCARAEDGTWTPLAVSKAVSNIDNIEDFYISVLRVQLSSSDESSLPGVRLRTYSLPNMAKMQIRFVERTGDAAVSASSGSSLTVPDFEAAKLRAKVRTSGRSLMDTALCGVDKWYDNHWGMDQNVVSLGDYIAAMVARNWTYFHLWSWNMYLVDPSGDAIQLDSRWGTNAPSWVKWAEDDALMNLCTQGNCSAAVASTAAGCLDAIAAKCGHQKDKVNTCFDCVHWNWDALVAADCHNGDTVGFCLPQQEAPDTLVV